MQMIMGDSRGDRSFEDALIAAQRSHAGFAFFDLDGTLSKGFISMDFMDYLYENRAYHPTAYGEQMEILGKYHNGNITYELWCAQWAGLWAKGLEGRTFSEIGYDAEQFFKGFRERIYGFSYDLVSHVKGLGYTPITVSMGAKEVVSLASDVLGMEACFATGADVDESGRYTGSLSTSLHLPGGKARVVSSFARPGNALAFGDSASDVEMLERVGKPVALNPSDELRGIARRHGWPVLMHTSTRNEMKSAIAHAETRAARRRMRT